MSKEEKVIAEEKVLAPEEDKAFEKETTDVSTKVEAPMGFEDEESGDMIIPRVKVINALSPEKKDKKAEEGDIINSLTLEKLNGKKFIPIFKFNNNILWRPRNEGGGIMCIARDGKCGKVSDGTTLICAACRKNEFDNTKTGTDALPKCTKYINFFGKFEGDNMPIVLSFAKTNYAEGKKLFSLAKVTMQNMWHFGYSLNSKLLAKNGNEWYNMVTASAGPVSEEEREFCKALYQQFRSMNNFNFDVEETTSDMQAAPVDTSNTEY
jgi:hypothetical protein